MAKISILLYVFAIFSSVVQSLPVGDGVATTDDRPGRVALENFPLIDTHNDFPHNLYKKLRNKLQGFSFDRDLSKDPVFGSDNCENCHTDLTRIRKGKLGAQFWVAYVICGAQHKDVVSRTLAQIDVIKRLILQHPNDMEFVTTADGILESFKKHKLAGLIGLEGGHSIDYKLSVLRMYYDLGVRYMTLTHSCNTPWAYSSIMDNVISSRIPIATNWTLTHFGKKIVWEMNRLGMMVDLSHVSYDVMVDAIAVSKAPVIFSHSAAYSITEHSRNVQDNVLKSVKINGGVVMVYFFCPYVTSGLADNATIDNVIEHINHIADVAGIDHVGIGSDFDGVNCVPKGLEDVSKYPDLFDRLKELNSTKWTIPNLEKLAGRNFFRVFKAVEQVKEDLKDLMPDEDLIPAEDLAPYDDVIEKCVVK